MAGVRKDGILQVDDVGGGGGVAVDATIVAPLPLPVEIVAPLGSLPAAQSVSVAIASDQLPLPVDIGAVGTLDVNIVSPDPLPVEITDPVVIAGPLDVVITRPIETQNGSQTTPEFVQVGGYDQFQNKTKILPIRSEFDPVQKADTDSGVLVRPLNAVIFSSHVFIGNGVLSANMLRYNAATVFITTSNGGGFVGTLTPSLIDNVGASFPTFVYDAMTGERVTTLEQDKAYFATVAGASDFAITCSGFGGGSSTVRISISPEPSGMLTAHISGGTIVTGGLTDVELRATPVPVSGPLTDAQLRASNVNVEVESRAAIFRGRSATFSTPGRAGTVGQKILSIHNATASPVVVRVRKVLVDLYQTVVKAITVAPPIVRVWKVTVLPTDGTLLAKTKIGGSGASDAAVTVRGDASADATGSGTTLTATLPAGTFIAEEYSGRIITAVGYDSVNPIEFVFDQLIELNALEGLVVFLDYVLATQNPTTDRWISAVEWDEN